MHAPRFLSLVHLSLLVSVADAADCADTCYDVTCQYYDDLGGTTSGICDIYGNDLEVTYGCDCSGCDCDSGDPTPAPNAPSPLPTCDAEVVAQGRRLSSCAAGGGLCYTLTCQYYDDLGGTTSGICDYQGTDLEVAYGCDCSGCDCDWEDPTPSPTTSSPTPSPTPSPECMTPSPSIPRMTPQPTTLSPTPLPTSTPTAAPSLTPHPSPVPTTAEPTVSPFPSTPPSPFPTQTPTMLCEVVLDVGVFVRQHQDCGHHEVPRRRLQRRL